MVEDRVRRLELALAEMTGRAESSDDFLRQHRAQMEADVEGLRKEVAELRVALVQGRTTARVLLWVGGATATLVGVVGVLDRMFRN